MNHKQHPLTITAFVILALMQTGVPLSMIARREATLKNGAVLKFRTAPVDPYDAFRGRYVALNVQQNSVSVTNAAGFARHQSVFVTFGNDASGFAVITGARSERPREGDYIKARITYVSGKTLHLRFPFDRYYMNEKLAPEAERAYREHSRRGKLDAFIKVRVSGGFAVIEDLFVSGKPILEFLNAD